MTDQDEKIVKTEEPPERIVGLVDMQELIAEEHSNG